MAHEGQLFEAPDGNTLRLVRITDELLEMALRILGIVLALFLAYVVGRAVGIMLGIGPYVTEVLAIAAVIIVVVVRSRRRDGAARA
jgi:hypothetical protein